MHKAQTCISWHIPLFEWSSHFFNIKKQTDLTLAVHAKWTTRNIGTRNERKSSTGLRLSDGKLRRVFDIHTLPRASLLFSQTWEGKQQYILAFRAHDCSYKP